MSRPFEGLLGNNCELRMLEYLLPLEEIEFNITELAEEVGVSRVTATRIVKKFVEWEVLNVPRTVGNTAYYSINHESPIVKSIEQFNNVLIENILGNETLYEIHDYWEAQRPHVPVGLTVGEMSQLITQGSRLQSSFQRDDIKPPQVPWGGDETPKHPPVYAGSSAANMHGRGPQAQVSAWEEM